MVTIFINVYMERKISTTINIMLAKMYSSGFSRETELIQSTETWERDISWNLAHTITETEKSHNNKLSTNLMA
jgi:hypothetical protein